MSPIDHDAFYARLPVWLQEIAVSLEGHRLMRRRYGPPYPAVEAAWIARDRISSPALAPFRNTILRAHLLAAATTPFWASRFAIHGVRPEATDPFAELAKLPVLTKYEARAALSELQPPGLPERELVACHTSGTTGAGLVFAETRAAERDRWSTWWRYRRRHGIDHTTWCGYFGGRSLVPLTRRTPPFWRTNRPGRQVMFSAYHLSASTAAVYVETLRKLAIPWLHGYPSTLALLASFVLEQGLHIGGSLRVITSGAESLLPHQRVMIERAFSVPVWEHYGQSESVANISMCEAGQLHIDEDYAGVELLPLADGSGMCRIIGTNWTNPAFPLLRYDTGDLARMVAGPPCPCGRDSRRVAGIDGRIEDYILLPNGAAVGRLDHVFKDLIHVREAQIVQCEPGHATLRVVKGPEYDAVGEESRLLREVRKRLGSDIILNVEYVAAIPRSAAGKLRFVISTLRCGPIPMPADSTPLPDERPT